MRERLRAGVVLACTLLAVSSAGAAAAEEDEGSCVTCHEVDIDEILAKPVPEWRESVHAAHWVSCDACHGGDPRIEDADESMSEEAGFMELPSWAEMADHCGMCHEAIAGAWLEGRFGEGLAAGQRVATCATCHMQDGHRIGEAKPAELVIDDSCPGCPPLSHTAAKVALLEEMERREKAVRETIAEVESLGVSLSDLRAELRDAHEGFQLSLHRFDDDAIERGRLDATAGYERLATRARDLEVRARGHRRLGFGMLAALALLFTSLWLAARARGEVSEK